MSARAPELGDECRPGGSCPVCNPSGCFECGANLDDDSGYTRIGGKLRPVCLVCLEALDPDAEEKECEWCGRPSGEDKWCSRECRRASESERA